MTPNPIIIRHLERRESECFVRLEVVVHGEAISRELRFDEPTFVRLERVFSTHPFPKKSAEGDTVLFRSLNAAIDDPKKYLGLLIVNSGSRHHVRIEVSEQVFFAFRTVLDNWIARFTEPNQSPQTTATSGRP